jgi:hypothetical protein
MARWTWSCEKTLKQLLQNAALWRGNLMTAFTLHFVQFMTVVIIRVASHECNEEKAAHRVKIPFPSSIDGGERNP